MNIKYSFRDPDKSFQFDHLHPEVIKHFHLVCHILNALDFKVDITSMVRPANTVPGESGVHATGRAIDFVPMETKKSGPITWKEMDEITDFICHMFPRSDGKMLMLWHSVPGGGGHHFHLQVTRSNDYVDLKGVVPKV